MSDTVDEIGKAIEKLEALIQSPDFWNDKGKAQTALRELADLKAKKEGLGKHDRGNAILSIVSGAGGDDAEDFSAMLFEMYSRFAKKRGWDVKLVNENKNDHGGYRFITVEVSQPPHKATAGAAGPYGDLKHESGVHRLVRISPFNAKKLRHTSFSLVEVLPKFSKLEEKDIELPPQDLRIEFSRAGGPGGQNVNKRETAVRVVHIPTNIAVHVSTERSQEQNRELALNILRAKIFRYAEAEKKSIEESLTTTRNTDIEWGNQIRSYVLHPYKMVKDHRTDVETSNVDAVLAGDLEEFIEAERKL